MQNSSSFSLFPIFHIFLFTVSISSLYASSDLVHLFPLFYLQNPEIHCHNLSKVDILVCPICNAKHRLRQAFPFLL